MENSSSGHVCNSPQHTSSLVNVSNSGASSTGDRYSRLAGEVFTVSPAQQSHSETKNHSEGRSDTHSPLVAMTTVVPTSTMSVCGQSSSIIPYRWDLLSLQEYVSAGIPSAGMEALMQHYQAAGFSKEVSRLAAAPRRPSTKYYVMTGGFASLTGSQKEELIRLVLQLLK